MKDWITIHRVDLLQDALMIKVQLELEDIEVEIPDEFTSQALQYYSNGIGGVRIQVRVNDQERGIDVLTKLGYLKAEEVKQNKVIVWLDNLTSKIPVFKKLRVELRVLLFLAIVLFLLIMPFYDLSIPTLKDEISEKRWCVSRVEFKGEEIQPISKDIYLMINGCAEFMEFRESGSIDMPKYDKVLYPKSWNEYKDGIYILTDPRYLDSNDVNVFEGEYNVVLEGGRLELRSKTTYILLHENSY